MKTWLWHWHILCVSSHCPNTSREEYSTPSLRLTELRQKRCSLMQFWGQKKMEKRDKLREEKVAQNSEGDNRTSVSWTKVSQSMWWWQCHWLFFNLVWSWCVGAVKLQLWFVQTEKTGIFTIAFNLSGKTVQELLVNGEKCQSLNLDRQNPSPESSAHVWIDILWTYFRIMALLGRHVPTTYRFGQHGA